jgi:hypothetical protein
MDNVNVGDFKGAVGRLDDMRKAKSTMDKIVNSLNSEFFATFYISNGKLWTTYFDDRGIKQTAVMSY